MLTPQYLDHCADAVIELYQKLDESIARDVARRLIKMGEISDTSKWQAEQLQHAGLLYDDVIAEVAKYANASEIAVRRAFEDAGVKSVDAETDLYLQADITIPPIRMNERAWNILQAALVKTSGELRNLTLTTAVATQQRFINACTLAEMQVSSGMMDYQTAIRYAICDASRDGASVLYPSGHIDRLDVAVRRAVLTGVNQTCGQISLHLAEEFGCDLMEITAHSGARPEHAAWQGKLVSLSGRRGYLSLKDIGYGTGAGFMGWNCRHSWNPFFEGISKPNYTPQTLAKLNAKNIEYNGMKYTEYEISQMQRKMERDIRATKRELVAFDEAAKTDPAAQMDFTQASAKLKAQEAKLKEFCHQTGQRVDGFRSQVQGFGHSQASKAVWANKTELEKYKEIHYHNDGTIVVTDDWKPRGKVSVPKHFKPNAVLETQSEYKNGLIQIDRTIYDPNAMMKTQIHSNHHNRSDQHKFGVNENEPYHAHDYIWDEQRTRKDKIDRSLTEAEKKAHRDILVKEDSDNE